MSKDDEAKQKTPKGEEIPIPKRHDFMRNLKKAAKSSTKWRLKLGSGCFPLIIAPHILA